MPDVVEDDGPVVSDVVEDDGPVVSDGSVPVFILYLHVGHVSC